jgi:hypothetical protein
VLITFENDPFDADLLFERNDNLDGKFGTCVEILVIVVFED